MNTEPDRESLRKTLTAFDARQKKIVGGVIAIMIDNPSRVRDVEWMTEQFAQVTLLASGFDDVASVQDGMAQIQGYAQENIGPLLNASYELFRCVGDDMKPRVATGFSREDAVTQALSYF